MSGYALHPEAFTDLDNIRDYIAQDSPDAADRVVEGIFDALRALVPSIGATDAGTSPHVLCDLFWCGNT